MINRISIKKFKSIEDIELNLGRINVLIGGNNSGKTSILQAIQFGVSIVQTVNLSKSIRWDDIAIVRSIEPSELSYSPLREVSALAIGGELKQGKKYNIEIQYERSDGKKVDIIVKRGKNRYIVAEIGGKVLGPQFQSMEEPFSIFVPGLAGIPYFEEFKTESIVRKAAARGDANNVFRNILWLLKQDDDKWNKFTADLHRVFPNIDIFVFFSPKTEEHISVKIIERKKVFNENSEVIEMSQGLPIDAVGTGVLQAIQILSYVNVYNPKMLILDEPDAHLHPDNQRKIIKMIIDLAEKEDFQVVLSTHSRHIIDEINDISDVFWIRDGRLVKEDEFDIVRVLMELGALDKGDLLKDGKIKCVVITEDSTDIDMIKILLKASGFKMDEVDVWSYEGCTKIDYAILLSAFIKKHAPSVKVLIHRDRDYLFDEEVENYREKIEAPGRLCFITKGTDIESYFLNPYHINHIYNSIDIKDCEAMIDLSTDERKDKSIKKFINSRAMIELNKSRKKGDGTIDNGEISLDCIKKYDDNKLRYRHGKIVIKGLNDKLQQALKQNINLIQESQFIGDDDLKKIASEIWI